MTVLICIIAMLYVLGGLVTVALTDLWSRLETGRGIGPIEALFDLITWPILATVNLIRAIFFDKRRHETGPED